MASVIFNHYFYDSYRNSALSHRRAFEIGQSMVLIAALCVGLTSLVWAVHVLHRHRKAGGRVSAFVIFLLLNDVFEMALSTYIVSKLLSGEKCYHSREWGCWILTSLWSGFRFCGLHFHLLVALEGILSLTHPQCSAHIFSPLYCALISVSVWAIVPVFEFLDPAGLISNLILTLVPLGVSVTVYCLVRLPPSTPDHAPHAGRRPGLKVLVVAMVTMFLLYEPGLWVLGLMNALPDYFYPESVVVMAVSFMSYRVITDPLLCVMICRENLRSHRSTQSATLIRDQSELNG